MRMKMIFVHDDVIQEIPAVKYVNNSIVDKALANKAGLLTTILYETENRRPNDIVRIDFERIKFNETGIYSYAEQVLSESTRVKLSYVYHSMLENFETNPLPVPVAPDLPNKKELSLLKSFILKKYPILLENTPFAFENTIIKLRKLHMEETQQMKNSHKKSRVAFDI